MAVTSYSAFSAPPMGSSNSGLDQVLSWIARDPGLAGANEASAISAGIAATNSLNLLLVQGLQDIGAFDKTELSVADIVSLNAWFRDPAHSERLAAFIALHGDDETGVETGFHTIQNDGGSRQFDGRALIDTVLDGLFHIGFPLSADGTRLTNEDGADNATLSDVARWLTALKQDLATTGTGLDRITETVVSDPGLLAGRPWSDIRGGAEAANNLNGLILQGIAALQQAGAADADTSRLSADEVRWINAWIRQDASRYASFVAWHGDDENGSETGFHLVQNDGATSKVFGLNAVNTVFDGIYHIGFEVNADGRFVNEDGDANARVSDVAEWISYYYGDASSTGSGLDRLVDWIQLDPGLPRWTSAKDINDGLAAANDLNQLLLEAIDATGTQDDGWISRHDLREINQWIRTNRYDAFVLLHGDDENGEETGFHLIQNDGGNTQFFGQNLVNTIADGIYHFGFAIVGENFVNEDGDTNQSLSDVSGWLNYFLSDRRLIVGTSDADAISGNEEADQVRARSGDDVVDGMGGSDLLDGGWGKDTLRGGEGSDVLDGGFDSDWLDGGAEGDLYLVSGADPAWQDGVPYSFQGYDTYADSGSSGSDVIRAEGFGAVDIGLRNFSAASGIEQILNATEGGARLRLLGNWEANLLDFSATQLLGGNVAIDAAGGKDTVVGTAQSDDIRGGGSDDRLDGGGGGDTYRLSGANPTWIEGQPYSFEGFDTYSDSGAAGDGVDRIVAEGDGPVDIGLLGFGPASGIEQIVNATAIDDGNGGTTTATVRLLGNWQANLLDFSATELVGGIPAGFSIDADGGKDTVRGSAATDLLRGGGDDDRLDGGGGGDTYEVSGWNPSNPDPQTYDFEGYDTYLDSGASSDGIDQIVAVGNGPVDIGLLNFDASSGIERILNATTIDDGNGGTTTATVRLLGNWQANRLDVSGMSLEGGNFSIDAGGGKDTVVGTTGVDVIRGGGDDDLLQGGGGNDTYEVSGSSASGFQGYDSYADNAGTDRIVAVAANGSDVVDIGLRSFSAAASGIEVIDATATSGAVRLLGDSNANGLNFSGVSLLGSNIRIDAGSGNDTVTGSTANDTLLGGNGDDLLNGAAGSDTYELAGTSGSGFQGYDSYADSGSGAGEIDRLVTSAGTTAVDIGLRSFSAAASGIEVIDATATSGAVRLLGDSNANGLNFSGVTLLGANLSIDLGAGNDTVVGSAAADRILAGTGTDNLNGAGGSDTYVVSGSAASGFGGYDVYADSGSGSGELDRIVAAAGTAAVDIGLTSFSAVASGIEVIDATATSGGVRLLGDSNANGLNFSGVSLLGSNLSIDAGSGNDTVTGSSGDDAILGGLGVDSLVGADGNDTLTGGGGLDLLHGGNGEDTFVITTLTDAIVGGTTTAPTFERITGFVVGLDRFDVTTLPAAGAFRNLGAVSALTRSGIGTLLSASNFVANGAATFTSGSGASQRTFIAFNNATAGYSATTDAVLEITGFGYASSFSSLAQISIV